jgi:alcohol dehydrogenase (cytochrome c)
VRAGRAATAIALVALLSGCGRAASWSEPNGSAQSTRASSTLSAAQASRLQKRWSFRIPIAATDSGAVTATPVVAGQLAYLQDLKSNVYALDLKTGHLQWRHGFDATNPGPNGLAIANGVVFGATDTTAFALSAKTGRLLWTRRILSSVESFVDVAPLVAGGRVFLATTGYFPGTRGKLYALAAGTGDVLWRVDTIKGPWRHPSVAGGGGSWYPPSISGDTVYWGTGNPIPWGGTRAYPNGAAFPGPVLYTDTLLALDARTGRILWHDQVTPHDIRDYDFQLSPMVVGHTIVSAGKAGLVIAWSAQTHKRLWTTPVGLHRNDTGPLPATRVDVCPGLFGGVETPMAEAAGIVFVPVVNLCMRGSATGYAPLASVNPFAGSGALVALSAKTGKQLWSHRLAKPDFGCAAAGNGVVFTSTLDGTVLALDAHTGATLWTAHMTAGINACPAIANGMLLVAAGVRVGSGHTFELVAYGPS